MTVKQLIEILSQIEDQNIAVMVRGYEGGFNDLETSANNIHYMALNVHKKWYYGSHEIVADVIYGDVQGKFEIQKAIILQRIINSSTI